MMTVHDDTVEKIRRLPESLAQEVNDFIDFLLIKHTQEYTVEQEMANPTLAETDMADYTQNLSDYEDQLARGEIQW